MSKKLAILIPTADRLAEVRELLYRSAGYLKDNNVDLYYYDSGKSSAVEEIIKEMNIRGFDNIYYIPVEESFSYGEKIDLIFSRYGIAEEYDYDYIWPMKDRVICNEKMLQLVLSRCDGYADVIVSLSLGNIYDEEVFNLYSPVDLYRIFGKQTTSLETVIYNTKRFLKDYKYGECEVSPIYRSDFWQFDVLYRRLAMISQPVIGIVSKNGAYNLKSSAETTSYWSKRYLEVWIEEWIRENYELPDIYSGYKLFVIKDTTSIEELLGTRARFTELHRDGILTKETYERYETMWEYVTDVPKDEIKKIATSEETGCLE